MDNRIGECARLWHARPPPHEGWCLFPPYIILLKYALPVVTVIGRIDLCKRFDDNNYGVGGEFQPRLAVPNLGPT